MQIHLINLRLKNISYFLNRERVMKKVVVLGAGISGLATAWFLKKKYKNSLDLTLIEKSARAGGWIRTIHTQGFLFEEGPRGFRPTGKGKTTLALVKELGLEEELVSSNNQACKRYIWLNGKLSSFSLGFLIRQGILRAALRDLLTPASTAEDETIADFTSRRFNRRIAEHLMDPLTKGIFGGDFRQLSIRNCFPLLWHFEKHQRSVIRGYLKKKKEKSHPVSLYTFKNGMETLPRMLVEKLGENIFFSKTVNSFAEIKADLIISAMPTSALAKLIQEKDPVEYATLATVNFGWHEQILKKRGYGFLVPSKEQGEILGMTWDSEIFPGLPGTRICVMLNNETALYERALNSLKYYLGITTAPSSYSISIARQAIPQYTLYHHQRIEAFKQKLPSNVYALGNCFGGVGINDCIFSAQEFVNGL